MAQAKSLEDSFTRLSPAVAEAFDAGFRYNFAEEETSGDEKYPWEAHEGVEAPAWDIAGVVIEGLLKNGYCTIETPTSDAACKALEMLASDKTIDILWSRPTPFLAEQYLGNESDNDAMLLDVDTLIEEKSAEGGNEKDARSCVNQLAEVCTVLSDFTERSLGFRSAPQQSHMMLRRREASDKVDMLREEVISVPQHLDFVRRRKICLMSFVTAADDGLVTLTPAQQDLGWKTMQLPVSAGTLLLFRHDLLNYCYAPASTRDLVVQSWILEAARDVDLPAVQGSKQDVMSFLGTTLGYLPKTNAAHVTSVGGRLAESSGADELCQLFNIGNDGVIRVPALRWDMDQYYSPRLEDGLSVCQHLGLISQDEVDSFDNKFWNIPDDKAQDTLGTKRKGLEVAYETLHGAGFTRETLKNAPISLGVGCILSPEWGTNEVKNYFNSSSTDHCGDPQFVSYHLGLTGKSFMVDSACSSSMITFHELFTEFLHAHEGNPYGLRHHGNCDQALNMGFRLQNNVGAMVGLSQARMVGWSGRSMSFDVSANGISCADAFTGVYFCYQDTSEAALNQMAAITGTTTNNDGRSASLTAPNGPAQTACFVRCNRNSQIDPGEIDLNESHVTGTRLGDPIEFGSTRTCFMAKPAERTIPLGFGAFKSFSAHPETGAGTVSIIKNILTIYYCTAPPNVHFRELNHNIDDAGFPFMIQSEIVDWGKSSMAIGCTGMGYGGSNARVNLAGTCRKGIHRAPGIASFSSGVVSKLDQPTLKQKSLKSDDVPYVLVTCPQCLGDMCFRCGLAFITENEYSQQHQCSLLREASAAYDCCSMCYKGRYTSGVLPASGIDNPGLDIHVVGSWSNWSEMLPMEQTIDEYGDECYFQTITLDAAGKAEFRLILDKNQDMALYPMVKHAGQNVRLAGPDNRHEGRSWLIDGSRDGIPAGTKCKVKFTWNHDVRAIKWWSADGGEQEVTDTSDKPSMSLTGSWNGWSLQKMVCAGDANTQDSEAQITIGDEGREEFYFVCGEDRSQAIFPAAWQSRDTSDQVLGPSGNMYGHAWLVHGEKGETVTINLHVDHWPWGVTKVVTTTSRSYGTRTWRSADVWKP